MACRKGELREEGRNRNAAAAAATSLAVSDALLFTTMCIIGMPVDVHAKDGSIYSGIFHTASVDKDYGIRDFCCLVFCSTLSNFSMGVLLPSNGITGYVRGDGIEAAAGYTECLDRDAEVVKPNELKGKKKHKSQSRYSAKKENGFPYAKTAKLLGSSSENHIERLETVNFVKDGDRSQEIQSDCNDNPEVRDKRTESKLNPGAKTFSPSMLQHRTVTPPAVANGASVAYMPGTYTIASMVTTQEEVDASSFARSSVPVKFVPYNNVAFGHGGNDAPYVQPIIGQVVNRTQPVRYTGQYQNFQTGPAYIHPNPQNDAQSATGLSPATTRPLLTPHQVHLPKHQGNASAQALQLCMTPSIMANGPQPFVMPSSIPISQSAFPVLRPIAVPGSNGFLSTKFA
ncbi:hypothetical protein DH2020_041676 [Rehmannia glutinosa]|uniref:Ataxin 2 SM domain-containing protein n=1 Tax=Rehmannia glutinosa TaxID=99300 RepID=A0ABR0UPG7_REHGL